MEGLPNSRYTSPEFGLAVDIHLNIKNSSLDVECSMDVFDGEKFGHIYKIAFDPTRASVNLLSFASGISLTVVFDRFVGADGVSSPFALHNADLAKLCTAFSLTSTGPESNMMKITHLVFSEPPLFMALDDLIGGTIVHHQSSSSCARAIEALMNLIAKPDMPRDKAWGEFRERLRIDEDYLRFITQSSKAGRHGNREYIPGPRAEEIVRRSWAVMNRFFEFRLRGNQALPDAEFPILEA